MEKLFSLSANHFNIKKIILCNLIKTFNDQQEEHKVISGAPHRVLCAQLPGGLLLPEFVNISHTPGKNPLFPAKLLDLKFEDSHVLQPLVVLALAFIQHGLLDLDLLVEQSQLIIAPD